VSLAPEKSGRSAGEVFVIVIHILHFFSFASSYSSPIPNFSNFFFMAGSKKQKMIVIGAGPVGTLGALYAAQRGHDVEIYDLRSGTFDKVFSHSSYFLLASPFLAGPQIKCL